MNFDDRKRVREHAPKTPLTDAEAAFQGVLDAYPKDWQTIAARIKQRSGGLCERCGHVHEVATGYVLTVHHLDGRKANCADWNLAALCQRCHLHIQAKVKMDQLFFTDILDVAPWFKPHLEGYLKSLGGAGVPRESVVCQTVQNAQNVRPEAGHNPPEAGATP